MHVFKDKGDPFKFHSTYIEVASYPYSPSSVYPSTKIQPEQVVEAGLSRYPPELRTRDRDIVLVPAPYKDQLTQWCEQNSIPNVDRVDVWDLLLEPFLDTYFDEVDQKRTIETLQKCKIDPSETDSIRRRVSKTMFAYNFDSMLWEWVHLGLSDLLDAHLGILTGPYHRLSAKNFAEFYWYAIDLANKGIPL